jgi:uncharacterized DUF497 family protein
MVYYLITEEGSVSFEFDEAKSRANKIKHGIDFVEAQQLWADSGRVQLPGFSDDEERFLVVGCIRERMWTAAITYRGGRVRLISVRRSRKEEVLPHEDQL